MKNLLILLCCIVLNTTLLSQNISFEEQSTLLEFPGEFLRITKPVFPLDFNQDGITDLFRKNENDEILIYKGLGNNEYNLIENDLDEWRWIPLKTMDYDNDGDQDLVTARNVAINDGNGIFSEMNPPSFNGYIVEAADFNQDGFTDILTHSNESNTSATQELILFYNQGDDTFTSEVVSSGHDYGDLDIGDIDNDSDLDIVALDYLDDFPFLILTNEGSSFTSQKTNHSVLISSGNIYLVDLDNDSDLDIVTNGSFEDIHMIENNENLMVDNTIISYSTPQISYFKQDDLNGDGFADLILYGGNNANDSRVYTLEGKGNFDFFDRVSVGIFYRPEGLFPANDNYTANNLSLYDFDQDGKTDILHTEGYSELNHYALIKNNSIISNVFDKKEVTQITVYPNPTSDYLSLSYKEEVGDEGQFKIFNTNGQFVIGGNYDKSLIPVKNLNSGRYVLILQDHYVIEFVKF